MVDCWAPVPETCYPNGCQYIGPTCTPPPAPPPHYYDCVVCERPQLQCVCGTARAPPTPCRVCRRPQPQCVCVAAPLPPPPLYVCEVCERPPLQCSCGPEEEEVEVVDEEDEVEEDAESGEDYGERRRRFRTTHDARRHAQWSGDASGTALVRAAHAPYRSSPVVAYTPAAYVAPVTYTPAAYDEPVTYTSTAYVAPGAFETPSYAVPTSFSAHSYTAVHPTRNDVEADRRAAAARLAVRSSNGGCATGGCLGAYTPPPASHPRKGAPPRPQQQRLTAGGKRLLGDAADDMALKRCCTGVTELQEQVGDVTCGGTSGLGAGASVGSLACSKFAGEYEGPCTESITLFLNAPRTADGFLAGTTLGTVGIPDILAWGSKLYPNSQAESFSYTANARECRAKCENNPACAGAVVYAVELVSGRPMCWNVLNINPAITPLDYRTARGARAAWIKPREGTPPNVEQLPTCLSKVCVAKPRSIIELEQVERWQKTGPWAFCLATASSACVGRLDTSPWCIDYCAQPYADCDAALKDHCGKLYISDPTEAVNGDMCPCFLPTKFYETHFDDLARALKIDPGNKQPPCVYARCAANATYRPYGHKTGSLHCPNVKQCSASINIDNEGRITTVDAKAYVKCFNDASGIVTPGDEDDDTTPTPKPKPKPKPKPDADTDADKDGADTDDEGGGGGGGGDDDDEKGLSRNTKLLLVGAAAALLLFLYARDRRKKEEAQALATAAAAPPQTYYQPQAPPQTYYQPQAPPQTYYQPQAPPQTYYQPQALPPPQQQQQYPPYPPPTAYPPQSRGPASRARYR